MVTLQELWDFFEINLALYGAEQEGSPMDFFFLAAFFLRDKENLKPFNERIH